MNTAEFKTMVCARSQITPAINAAIEAEADALTRAAMEKLRARYVMAQDERRAAPRLPVARSPAR